ncbi:MAG: flagellar FlbD family protein [Chitinispirillales bacterium]|jgi:flagellar protein FlbD|nr:flagellar FlbD family protein [Chitinispirillales bacterium]
MIALQKLSGEQFVLNADHIETIESTPDTVITLNNGKKHIVGNGIEDIVRKSIKYRQLCGQALQVVNADGTSEPAASGVRVQGYMSTGEF